MLMLANTDAPMPNINPTPDTIANKGEIMLIAAMPDEPAPRPENAVDNHKHGVGHHRRKSREKQYSEQPRDIPAAIVKSFLSAFHVMPYEKIR